MPIGIYQQYFIMPSPGTTSVMNEASQGDSSGPLYGIFGTVGVLSGWLQWQVASFDVQEKH